MKALLATSLLACALVGSTAALAADALPAQPPVAPTAIKPSTVPSAFQQAVHLRGTIGDEGVQVAIRPKVPAEDGIEGEYFFFGQSLKILIAGDIDGDVFLLEESQDGKRISGQWDGTIAGDKVSGTWMSADGTVTKPFVLQIMPTANAVTQGKKTAIKK